MEISFLKVFWLVFQLIGSASKLVNRLMELNLWELGFLGRHPVSQLVSGHLCHRENSSPPDWHYQSWNHMCLPAKVFSRLIQLSFTLEQTAPLPLPAKAWLELPRILQQHTFLFRSFSFFVLMFSSWLLLQQTQQFCYKIHLYLCSFNWCHQA